MSTIQINALNPAGSDLFADQESYLQELTDAEMTIAGGISPTSPTAVIVSAAVSGLVGYSAAKATGAIVDWYYANPF